MHVLHLIPTPTPQQRADECPACDMGAPIHYRVDGDPLPSRPGAPTVCGHCGAILIFGQGLSLRLPTLFEMHRWMHLEPRLFETLLDLSAFFEGRARHRRG